MWKGNSPNLISILRMIVLLDKELWDKRKDRTKILEPPAWVRKYLIIPSNIREPPLKRGRKEKSVNSNPTQIINQLSPDTARSTPTKHLGIIINHLGYSFINIVAGTFV